MKTEISRDSHQPKKRYSGVYQQQGRMLTDADWNELVDILKDQVRDALTDVVGKGSPLHSNVVNNDSSPTQLHWGTVFVDGIQAAVRADASATPGPEFDYLHQLDFPQAPGIPEAPDNNYIFYADVWERTVTHLMDERLRDKGLHGADTCTRKQLMAQVKWCPAGIDPETANQNPAKGDAQLTVSLLPKTTTPDSCDPCAEQLDIDTRVGNYLFRVEIHDVIGAADDPSEITLKWSVENAAELFALKSALGDAVEPPESFKDAPWLYEFFDEVNEQQLGVQLASGFTPQRGKLIPGYPEAAPSEDFVRRWDGYCKLLKTAGVWSVTEQYDRNQSGPGLAIFTEIDTTELKVSLDAQSLLLTLDDSFVAGDYWIAEVREIEHDTDSVLLDQSLPAGILHHYLTLGEVKGGVLQENPEADRKYAFPPLSEMTRMFIAGGDGQQAMPAHDLLYPLQIDVANGEWPVTGARVKCQVETGGGSLSKPASVTSENFESISASEVMVISEQGVCGCNWQLGTADPQRVKVTLLAADGTALDHPPVYFNANFSTADQLAYTPECQGGTVTVHSLLDADDANVNWPGLDEHGHTTVKNVLDTLLCKLDASKTPYDAMQQADCWQDILSGEAVSQPETVQQAIDLLACRSNSSCCNIFISPGEDIQAKLSVIKNGQDADICFDQGEYQVVNPILLENKGHITLTGRGYSTRILASGSESVFRLKKCKSVTVRDIAMQSGKEGETGGDKNLNGTLDIDDVNLVTVDGANLTCPTAHGERSASCLTVSYTNPPDKKASVRVRRSLLNPGHQQVGLLLVNGSRAQIEDNEIRVRSKSRNWVLKDKLKIDKFRGTFRGILISNISLAENSDVSGIKRNASMTYEGTRVHFSTPPDLVTAWPEYIAKNPPATGLDNQGVINYLKDIADQVLLREIKDAPEFDRWYRLMESSLPAIASQGIVCAGRTADDIRVLNNSVYGAAQGIHVGLSHHDAEEYIAYQANRVQIRGNQISLNLSSENIGERHGIFVGNCESLDIDSNHIKVERYPDNNSRKIEGIRVYGLLGAMMLIRNNHVIDFTTGIFVRASDTDNIGHHLWKVSSNMLENASTGVDVSPAQQFILEHNP